MFCKYRQIFVQPLSSGFCETSTFIVHVSSGSSLADTHAAE